MSPYIFNLTDDLPTEPHEIYIKQKELKHESNPRLSEEFEVIRKVDFQFYFKQQYSRNNVLQSLNVVLFCL